MAFVNGSPICLLLLLLLLLAGSLDTPWTTIRTAALADTKTVVVGGEDSGWSPEVRTWQPPLVNFGDVLVFEWNNSEHEHDVVGVDQGRFTFCYFGTAGPPMIVISPNPVFKWNDSEHEHDVVGVDPNRFVFCYFGKALPPIRVFSKASKQGSATITVRGPLGYTSSVGNDCRRGMKVVIIPEPP